MIHDQVQDDVEYNAALGPVPSNQSVIPVSIMINGVHHHVRLFITFIGSLRQVTHEPRDKSLDLILLRQALPLGYYTCVITEWQSLSQQKWRS